MACGNLCSQGTFAPHRFLWGGVRLPCGKWRTFGDSGLGRSAGAARADRDTLGMLEPHCSSESMHSPGDKGADGECSKVPTNQYGLAAWPGKR